MNVRSVATLACSLALLATGVRAQPSAAPVASEAPVAQPPQDAGAPAAAPTTVQEDPEELLARLDAELGQTDSIVGTMPGMRLYGFADFSVYKYLLHEDSAFRTLLYPRSAFAVGNLNLYLASELGEDWQSLIEVRFAYLPNGSKRVVGGEVERTDTSVQDYTNPARQRPTGSILIERAWLEYAASPLFVVRGGSWLTPYGIWNEDHGTPTIIPVFRPYVVGLELLPERQTGIQIHGLAYPSDTVSVGYALAVSNGRGPVQSYADLDENKALTFRAHAMHHGVGTLTFGASAYAGRYTNTSETAVLDGAGVRIVERVEEQYDELAWGVDAKYVLGGLHAQGEFIMGEQAFTRDGRPERTPGVFQPDNRRFGGYAVGGYRFEWLGLMPYFVGEYFALSNVLEPTRSPANDVILTTGLGLNSRPTHNVTLKLEGNAATFHGDIPEGSLFEHPILGVQGQAAWAF